MRLGYWRTEFPEVPSIMGTSMVQARRYYWIEVTPEELKRALKDKEVREKLVELTETRFTCIHHFGASINSEACSDRAYKEALKTMAEKLGKEVKTVLSIDLEEEDLQELEESIVNIAEVAEEVAVEEAPELFDE